MTKIRNLALLCIVLLGVSGIFSTSLPAPFTAEGNPQLYKELRDKARDNLRRLDSPKKQEYQKLLRSQDDVLMAYLLAYESDANLQQADPQAVLSNYEQIRAYLETYGNTHAPEFFLSYVADQTVSDERIEAYRAALLDDGLREILENSPNELELYRAVSQWCVARLKFQPTSGRDQSPLDITQKSILGRCEEMQILFVAAARTVGLPARAASTPWWPHTDNNHAWAEVWLDGAWHYTGDMDAAYYPDQTWFSSLIDKTVLILADGSLPSDRDEVLVQGKYECVINSIRNYAGENTRTLDLRTVDAQGRPLADVELSFMVYNWNSLRSLATVRSKQDGTFRISVGRGAFYISAFKDGKKALQLIPSGEVNDLEHTLVLTEDPLPDQNEMLAYPGNPFEWKKAPQEWDDGVALAKARWNEMDLIHSSRADAFSDSLSGELASAARGNFPEIERFLARNPRPDREFLAYLLSEDPSYSDPKFLWQCSAEQLEALQLEFQLREQGHSYQDLASVIAPTVFYEELSLPCSLDGSHNSMYPKDFYKAGRKGGTRTEKLKQAMTWLRKKYKINSGKALQGLIPLDVAARRKHLNSYQYRILAVSLARASGIPAEFTRQPNLIYVQYDNGEWGYYDLVKCAPEADVGDTGAFAKLNVLANDDLGVPVSGISGSLVLSRYQNGMFYWLDQSFKPSGQGGYEISVPKGEYYLNLGYRVSDSQTAFQLRHLDLAGTDSLRLEMVLAEFPRKWGTDVYLELAEVVAAIDTLGVNTILIGNYDQENSIRTAEQLRGLGRDFLWLGHDPAPAAIPGYQFSPAWREKVAADQRNRLRTITLVRNNGDWQGYEGRWERLPE
ncbi:MAG: transglutaminase-like domain-containing protein [Candidatus Syntrophosphaera sp.]|nr:transglutaminase-like domain-containing protein [Candidatus Syntrophosphaera sp.]